MFVTTWSDVWYYSKMTLIPWWDRLVIRAHGRLPKALRYIYIYIYPLVDLGLLVDLTGGGGPGLNDTDR